MKQMARLGLQVLILAAAPAAAAVMEIVLELPGSSRAITPRLLPDASSLILPRPSAHLPSAAIDSPRLFPNYPFPVIGRPQIKLPPPALPAVREIKLAERASIPAGGAHLASRGLDSLFDGTSSLERASVAP